MAKQRISQAREERETDVAAREATHGIRFLLSALVSPSRALLTLARASPVLVPHVLLTPVHLSPCPAIAMCGDPTTTTVCLRLTACLASDVGLLEYDDVYGSSLPASVEERDMCVSPGTMAQFTFYRRASDDDIKRPHMDSISEDDGARDIDHVLDQMDIEDEAAVPVRELASQSEFLLDKETRHSLQWLSEVRDMKESEHRLYPLLSSKGRRQRICCRTSKQQPRQQPTFLCLQQQRRHSPHHSWFTPVQEHMRLYARTQAYCFDFPDPAVRFALSAKAKGSVCKQIRRYSCLILFP